MKYSVDLPYPPIKVKTENSKFADLILLNYAGSVSEFSAITQYTYHEIALKYKFEEVSETIQGIAEVEMHHLQMLGELIVKLGKSPGYWICKHKKLNFWTPEFISYSTDLKKVLAVDINDEKEAITQYKRTIQQIDDSYIIDIIDRIILDEEYHIKLFTELYNKYLD